MEIIINQGFKIFHLQVQLIHSDQRCERYKVFPPQDPDKYFIIENNKPLIRGVYKLKKRRIDWKKIEGQNISPKTLEEIYRKIESPEKKQKPFVIPPPLNPDRKIRKDTSGYTLGDRMKKDK